MKKIFLGLSIFGLLSTSTVANTWVIGKLKKVETWMNSTYYFMQPDGEQSGCIVKFYGDSGMSTDAQKLLSAISLTAITTDATIEVFVVGDGHCGPDSPQQSAPTYAAKGVRLAK